jgi:hypothetical protein
VACPVVGRHNCGRSAGAVDALFSVTVGTEAVARITSKAHSSPSVPLSVAGWCFASPGSCSRRQWPGTDFAM